MMSDGLQGIYNAHKGGGFSSYLEYLIDDEMANEIWLESLSAL